MKNSNTRLGFLARADNGGLGCESWEFAKHLQPDKVLVIRGEHGHYPERYQGLNCQYTDGVPTHAEIDSFLRGIDVIFSFETFYNWGAIPMARARNIKTVLRINYEMNLNQVDPNLPIADLFLVPSSWHYDEIPFANKQLTKFPVNREVLPFTLKKEIKSFYHIAGHLAHEDRNGTQALLDALSYIKSRKPINILSQHPIDFDFSPYPFVNYVKTDFENYWDVHQGDCLILPRRFGGQTLQMNEALSLGNPVLMPAIEPNDFLPTDMLFEPSGSRKIVCQGGEVDCAVINPSVLAREIDTMAEMNTMLLSNWANDYAETISWSNLTDKYIKIFEEVHAKNTA